ncbi:hypothetical protein AMR72_16075 [Flavobacterium psychrophilum]|nr:hypothetical protein AMR72_16075 [Flavobacterium psychrophilum]AOE53887.1 hypothetical protein ALW18_16065 [Flavobacterium psychrophilum]
MPDSIDTSDKTYTLSSDTSNYGVKKGLLNLLLPTEDPENPYLFTIYDLSQIVNGQKYNALFVCMKKTDDNGEDLSSYDNDATIHSYPFMFNQCTCLDNLATYSSFDKLDEDIESFVIIYHDTSDDELERRSDAEKAFDEVPAIYNNLILNGNFQQTMELTANKPRKTGVSRIPKI